MYVKFFGWYKYNPTDELGINWGEVCRYQERDFNDTIRELVNLGFYVGIHKTKYDNYGPVIEVAVDTTWFRQR